LLLPKKLSNSAITPAFRAALWRNLMIAPSLAGKSLAIPDRNYRTEILALEGWTLARCPAQVNFSALIRIELPSLLFARHCSTCAINSSLHFDSMRKRTYCSSSRSPERRKQ
jgi:hypothetical protein